MLPASANLSSELQAAAQASCATNARRRWQHQPRDMPACTRARRDYNVYSIASVTLLPESLQRYHRETPPEDVVACVLRGGRRGRRLDTRAVSTLSGKCGRR